MGVKCQLLTSFLVRFCGHFMCVHVFMSMCESTCMCGPVLGMIKVIMKIKSANKRWSTSACSCERGQDPTSG